MEGGGGVDRANIAGGLIAGTCIAIAIAREGGRKEGREGGST